MRFWKWFFLLLGPALVGLFIGVMLMVIYPSSLTAAAFLCPEDKPDVFVVRYKVSTSDGEGTNFTLYCMSERGETEEIGTWLPLLVICGICVAVLYALLLLLVGWRLVKGVSGGPSPPSDLTGTSLTPEQLLTQQAPPADPLTGVQQPPPPPPFD